MFAPELRFAKQPGKAYDAGFAESAGHPNFTNAVLTFADVDGDGESYMQTANCAMAAENDID